MIALFIVLILGLAALFFHALAWLLIRLAYAFIALAVHFMLFVSTPRGYPGLLVDYEIHTVFMILIHIIPIGIWFALQQLRVFGVMIFKIIACGFSAYIFVWMALEGFFGYRVMYGMDTIWQWTVGIVYFGILIALRARDDEIIDFDSLPIISSMSLPVKNMVGEKIKSRHYMNMTLV